ncbi:MAG: hypothetical protein PWP65_1847 [Clostridia bacterium]|nr:hypothetical protein [Clostridia bacterium]
MDNKPFFSDAAFWERAWQEARQSSLYSRRLPGRDGPPFWDRRAASFAEHSQSEEGQCRVAGILHLIGHHANLSREAEVLDIGCGPGNLALPLARRVKRVVALDPSEEMLNILRRRMAAEGVDNIEPVRLTWEEVDLEALGWHRRFDLVLALMTPGIHDAITLKKMLAAAKGSCLLGGHLRQEEPARQELWRELVGGEMPPIPPDVLYIFHLLYAWGYYPSLEMERRESEQEVSLDRMTAELENFFYPYLEITPAVRRTIAGYLEARSSKGIYRRRREFVAAYVSWSV